MVAKSWLSVASLHPWVTSQILLEWHRGGRSSPVHSWWRFPLWLDRLSLRFSSASQNRPGPQSETWLSASRTRPSRSFRWRLCYQSQFLAEWQWHAQTQVSFTALRYAFKSNFLKILRMYKHCQRHRRELGTGGWWRWRVIESSGRSSECWLWCETELPASGTVSSEQEERDL